MNLALSGLDEDAQAFLGAYQSSTGGPVVNRLLWKFAAAMRPIHFPEGWMDATQVRERFRRFVQQMIEEETSASASFAPEDI